MNRATPTMMRFTQTDGRVFEFPVTGLQLLSVSTTSSTDCPVTIKYEFHATIPKYQHKMLNAIQRRKLRRANRQAMTTQHKAAKAAGGSA